MASKSSHPKKTFLILDGHSVLHRAWHALPSMTSSDGTEVRGAYGFTTMLLGAIKEFKPDFVAVALDLAGKTFRHDDYEGYKATREKKPDELYSQVDVIREILGALRVPVFTAVKFEADDVIGTLTALAPKQDAGVECIIATGDQDSFQLVDKKTRVYMPRRRDGKTVMELVDEHAVMRDFGFAPKTLIDYKALRGDTSDNIPGVRGIGEVTAKKLLAEFGSVPKLYAALEKGGKKVADVPEKTRELLLRSKRDAMQALDLCTIRREIPLEFALKDCAYVPSMRAQVSPVFTKLGFMKLLQHFPGESAAPVAAKSGTASMFGETSSESKDATAYIEVRDMDGLTKALEALAKPVKTAFRFLTDKDPYAPHVIALALTDGKSCWIVTKSAFETGKPLLAKYFGGTGEKVCHDLKQALKTLVAAGIATGGMFFDLMIASYLLQSGERKNSLDSILAYQRGVALDETNDESPLEAHLARLAVEIAHLLPLEDEFSAALKKNGLTKLNDEIGLPLAAVLAKMERAGVAVDVPYLHELSEELGGKIDKLTKDIHKMGGEFNINSPAQMKTVLFEKLEISPLGLKKTAKGGTLSTAAAELEKLRDAHPIIGKILEYRELTKLKSTYVDSLPALVHPKTGRIHAEFNQTVAATGRLSSANPNLQNIPTPETEEGRKVRNAFIAPKGRTLVSADYSQFELRIVAHIAHEKVMIDAFRKGEDIHWRTSAQMFGEENADKNRRIAKVINFGILYGMGPQRLAENANISFLEAKQYIDKYFELHKGIAKYVESTKEKMADDGYVETMFGRKRFFKNVRLMNPRERAESERQAVNMPIQGTQADMLQMVMIKLDQFIAHKYPDGQVTMISQVHDELLFEVADGTVEEFIPHMERLMDETVKLDVPVAVHVAVGKRWGDIVKRK
ncbi:MAG: polymerase [Candidatus Parcubacteria bacterium]|jgi:DNA polymerase-1